MKRRDLLKSALLAIPGAGWLARRGGAEVAIPESRYVQARTVGWEWRGEWKHARGWARLWVYGFREHSKPGAEYTMRFTPSTDNSHLFLPKHNRKIRLFELNRRGDEWWIVSIDGETL